MKVSVAEARNTLPKLITAVEEGESVTICRHGTPVVDMVRTTKADAKKPKFGTLKGKVTALDPDWWKPMGDDEVEALLGPPKLVEALDKRPDVALVRTVG